MKISEIIKIPEIENGFPKPRNYTDIKTDISKRGIQVPLIISTKNELICGYTRYQIAQELGIDNVPVSEPIAFMSLNEMKCYAIKDNDLRRQMSDLERYEYVVKPLMEIEQEEAEQRKLTQLKQGDSRQTQNASNGEVGKSVDIIGAQVGWSGDKVQRLKIIATKAAPEVKQKLNDHEITQRMALEVSKVNDYEKQNEIISTAKDMSDVTRAVRQFKKSTVPFGNPLPTVQLTNAVIFCQSSENMDGELIDINGNKHTISDNSVHLVVTSPPYNMNISYDIYDDNKEWDVYVTLLKTVFTQCYKKLVSGGRIAVNIPNVSCKPSEHPKFMAIEVSKILSECGFITRELLTWVKTKEHEESAAALVATSTAWGSWQSPCNPSLRSLTEFVIIMHKENATLQGNNPDITANEFKEWTRNVWFIPSTSSKRHPAVFPVALAQRLVKLYSFPSQIILDPFMGIGSTGMVCVNRRFIGFDISNEYCIEAVRCLNEQNIS